MSSAQLAAGVDQFSAVGVTTAGFALGLALLGVEHYRWYRGSSAPAAASGGKGKGGPPAAPSARSLDPKAMIAYWFGMTCGILMVGCPGGLANAISEFFRWTGNGIGGLGMSWLTGHEGTQLAQGGSPEQIDGFGAVLVSALFIALILLRKVLPKAARGKWWKGVFTSCLLCITTGTAALIAGAIIGGANDLSHMILDAAVHGTLV